MKSRQDASVGSAHDVSSILQILPKEGVLRTNIAKLSMFSRERTKGEVSFEQWTYELQTLWKSYSDSALREGIQYSLREAATDAVHNMGPNVPLDMIIKITIVYDNVRPFDLLMRDFYQADQGEEETIPSFPQGYRDSCPKLGTGSQASSPNQEEQRLLKDHLFHSSRKSIRDSMKYCFAEASLD